MQKIFFQLSLNRLDILSDYKDIFCQLNINHDRLAKDKASFHEVMNYVLRYVTISNNHNHT